MKFFFLYNPQDGKVASYSEGENVSDKFSQVELEVTQEQHEKMLKNYLLFIRNDELEFEKTPDILDEESVQKKKLLVNDIKSKIKDIPANQQEVINLLLDLIR